MLGIVLTHGKNEVDPDDWRAVAKKLKPEWLAALQTAPDGVEPDLVLHIDDAPSFPGSPGPIAAKARIEQIEACDDLDRVERFAQCETRKTVLAAVNGRIDELLLQERHQ